MDLRGKVLSLSEAVERYVHDGALISFGGFSATQCPMAAVQPAAGPGV